MKNSLYRFFIVISFIIALIVMVTKSPVMAKELSKTPISEILKKNYTFKVVQYMGERYVLVAPRFYVGCYGSYEHLKHKLAGIANPVQDEKIVSQIYKANKKFFESGNEYYLELSKYSNQPLTKFIVNNNSIEKKLMYPNDNSRSNANTRFLFKISNGENVVSKPKLPHVANRADSSKSFSSTLGNDFTYEFVSGEYHGSKVKFITIGTEKPMDVQKAYNQICEQLKFYVRPVEKCDCIAKINHGKNGAGFEIWFPETKTDEDVFKVSEEGIWGRWRFTNTKTTNYKTRFLFVFI